MILSGNAVARPDPKFFAGIIDLVLIGDIDLDNLQDLTRKTEKYINRKIRTLALKADEYNQLAANLDKRPNFVLWQQEDF